MDCETESGSDTRVASSTGEPASPAAGAPATSADRTGYLLRALAGVDERLLAKSAPLEKTRFTSLGALLVGTAVIASLSMWVGLRQVSDAGWLLAAVLVLPAVVWGAFVLVMDRALITSVSGSRWWNRLPSLIVRMVLAGILGIVIAEPLVLQLFGSAIEQDIRDRRDAAVDSLRDRLVRCNPLPTQTSAPAGSECVGATLTAGEAFSGTAALLKDLKDQEQGLRDRLATEADEQRRLDEIARNEEAGTAGPGLSGVPGCASLCQENKRVADDYARDHPRGPLDAQINDLQTRISSLGNEVGTRSDGFEQSRNNAIAARVAQLAAHQQGIGLLERMEALDRLTSERGSLWLREWFIRLALIVIDSLPVLVKFLGGVTEYDRAVDREQALSRSVHASRVRVREKKVLNRLEQRAKDHENRTEVRSARSDMDRRSALNDIRTEEDGLIEEDRRRNLRMANAGPA